MTRIAEFLADENGATAIEYSLIVALIAVMIIAGVMTVGVKLNQLFVEEIVNALK
ncbi:MAG: Flp family type IVb pilin [Beijerinckiaceae bacterium]